jgi:hypothetical protein
MVWRPSSRSLTVAQCLWALTGLAVVFGCRRSEPHGEPVPPDEAQKSAPAALGDASQAGIDFAKPRLDLPAERLAERVDGAEVKLRGLGCRRLRLWRLGVPPADLELLTFANEQGAIKLLAEDAGADRTPNAPGDEGWVGTNALYFRRGALLARLIADGRESASTLIAPARALDQAIAKGEVAP